MTDPVDQTDASVDEDAWRHEFGVSGYGIMRRAIGQDTARVATEYMRMQRDYYEPLLLFDRRQQSYGRYNDPLGESLLAVLSGPISERTGLDLLPTYSFSRIYLHDGVLDKHIDRPSCELSATLLLGSDQSWPIFVEVDGQSREVQLSPGDLMVYRGCKLPHWRDRYSGEYSAHVFLHFVEADGPYGHLAYDERAGLGAPQLRNAPLRFDADDPSATGGLESSNQSRSLKIRRNEPCPCGSGKRFKNCHGART